MEIQDEVDILKRLKFNTINHLNWFERGLLPLISSDNRVGICISYFKIISLHNNIYYGAYSLKSSWEKEVRDLYNEISSSPIFFRTMHLQNAYVIYNSCVDYVYQVLYFYYDLDSCIKEVNSHDELLKLEKNVKSYRRDHFDKEIKIYNLEIYDAIKEFRMEIKGLNKKANNIKHDAGYWIDGNHMQTIGSASIGVDGKKIDLTEIITPRLNDISEEIEFLIKVHNAFVKLEITLFEQLKYETRIKNFLER